MNALNPDISIITPVRARSAQEVQWLDEAIGSVMGQSGGVAWEMIVVDNNSTYDLAPVREKYGDTITWGAEPNGEAATARNHAASLASAPLLLPLDADDKLASNALQVFTQAWAQRGEARIIYSDVVMFGPDYARVFVAPEYSFERLLQSTFMLVGSLHERAAWETVGGWKTRLDAGLEDWEYWLALGELGFCGKRIAEPLYWYRRNPQGRLANLKAHTQEWARAYGVMRELHVDSYNGRFVMGCCGGSAPKPTRAAVVPSALAMAATADRAAVLYTGTRQGDFWLVGNVTRNQYHIVGIGQFVEDANGRPGVDPRDVPFLLSMTGTFRLVAVPVAAVGSPTVSTTRAPAPVTRRAESWDTAIMESVQSVVDEALVARVAELETQAEHAAEIDPADKSVREIEAIAKAGEMSYDELVTMLNAELVGKKRKGAIEALEQATVLDQV